MDEKEKQEETQEEPKAPAADNDGGNKKEEPGPIEQARVENDRKAKLLEEETALQDRKEKLHAEQMVGGKAEAGGETVKKTEDEKWAEEAKERYKDTGMDPTPDDTPTTYG